MTGPTCQYCGCGEDTPCAGGCSWTDETRTVCTTCELGRLLAQVSLKVLAHFHPAANLWVEGFADRPFDERQALVMAGRAIVEQIDTSASEDLDTLRHEVTDMLRDVAARLPEHVFARARREEWTLAKLVHEAYVNQKRIVLAR